MRMKRFLWLGFALSLALAAPETYASGAAAMASQSTSNEIVLDNFESGIGSWKAEPNSSIGNSTTTVASGKGAMKWTLHSDGVNAYGNNITFTPTVKDWSAYSEVVVDLYSAGPVAGRIGCQISADGKEVTLDDINPFAKEGAWKAIKIPLYDTSRDQVAWLRFFCDGVAFPKGDHVFYIDNLRLKRVDEKKLEIPRGDPLPTFSSLSAETQKAIRKAVTPPPLAQRHNPYSTPMYYQMWGGSSFDGKLHEDWQEVLIKDWAELGMTKLHFYLYPHGNGTPHRDYTLSQTDRDGIQMFLRLCKKYSMKVGLRVDLPNTVVNVSTDAIAYYWISNPNNPDNELRPYCAWLSQVVNLLKGNLEYVILGDEIPWKTKIKKHAWNARLYMQVFKQCAETIHQADPSTKVSMFSASSGDWNEVLSLLQDGYAKYGDAVAINCYDYNVIEGYKQDLKKYSPHKKLALLSNGVGYISSDTTPRNPPKDPYSRYNDLNQAAMIARTMYTWWAVGAEVAPYYVCLRGYTYKGEYHPWWFGFFGFEDLNIDESGKATIKRYPGWYAYQTIANVFYDYDVFHKPSFKIEAVGGHPQLLKAYERRDGKELLIITWGFGNRHSKTDVRINSTRYGYPVKIDLLDYHKWTDVSATKDAKGVMLYNVQLGLSPTIIRLVRFPWSN